jgi:signal transduction histidine kinase
MKYAPTSLWMQLGLALVASSLVAVALASVILYERYKSTNSTFRENTLRNEARIISKYLRHAPDQTPLVLPPALLQAYQEAKGTYAIAEEDGTVLAATPGVMGPLNPIDERAPLDYFVLETQTGQPLYGLSAASSLHGKPVWVQVAFVASDIIFDSVIQDFLEDVAWIWIPFVVVLIGVNLLVARLGLRPLRSAARRAAAIGPSDLSARLPEDELPSEVLALVTAVNTALDRVQAEFALQRAFIADAAHELRTPVSVLKAHVGILPHVPGIEALNEEVDALERLVNQLLDSARLDTLRLESQQLADLNKIAEDVAAHLAPLAIGQHRALEVVSEGNPVIIRGNEDFLFRALRNLVENAVKSTPSGTTVTITVEDPPAIRVSDKGPGIPPDEREIIFQRFWQGRRDRGDGAGLGMDIASRTVSAHGGSISIEDAPGGGALFTVRFPQMPARQLTSPGGDALSNLHK